MMGAYLCLILAFVFIMLGSPTFMGFGLLMTVLGVFLLDIPPVTLALDLWSNIDSYTLLGLPFFIYAGSLMTEGGSSTYLVGLINTFVRHIRGGLAIVVILSCGFFAAMSGSLIATAAAIGLVMHKFMKQNGYPEAFTGAVICAGATLGPIIPPSIWMIVYCGMSESNVAKMFMAGFIPGVLLMAVFIGIIGVRIRKLEISALSPASWSERRSSFIKAIPALLAPFVILGGIYGGVFTPTEAGAVACVLAFFVGVFIYKGLNSLQRIKEMSRDAAYVTANIFILITTALLMGALSSRLGIAQAIASFVLGMELSPGNFLLLLCVILVFLGCFLEAFCIMVITVPLLFPAASSLGIDAIQFGMIIVFGLGVGQLTPPLGISLFTVAKFTNQPSGPVFRAVTPLTLGMVGVMILLAQFPQLSLWLPRLLMP